MTQSIPAGLTRSHVLQALADLDAGVDHPFGQPTGYSTTAFHDCPHSMEIIYRTSTSMTRSWFQTEWSMSSTKNLRLSTSIESSMTIAPMPTPPISGSGQL
jgi:hypothetical protein